MYIRHMEGYVLWYVVGRNFNCPKLVIRREV